MARDLRAHPRDGLRHVRHFEQEVEAAAGVVGAHDGLHALDGGEARFGIRGTATPRVFLKEAAALRRFRDGGINGVIFRIRQCWRRLTFVGQVFF